MFNRLLILAAAILTFASCSSEESTGSDSVEYKMATIDEGAPPNASLVATYASTLDSLEPKCDESRSKIGDMSVVSRDLLEDKGIRATLLQILRDVDRSIPAEFGEQPCADIFASYVTLRSS
jgi:hypothetical protein